MPITTIINPRARNGRAGKVGDRIRRIFDNKGIEGPIVFTEGPGHAIELARKATSHSQIVAAVGGDGTISEVANGIIQSGKDVGLGIIPFGTGNDFVKMTGTPKNLESAIKILVQAKRKAVDYGSLSYLTESEDGHRFFVNTAGIGFDAEVGLRASSFKMLPGFTAYLAALIGTLHHSNRSDSHVEIFGANGASSFYSGPLLLSTLGNGQYSGGIFRLTPDASIEDGWLDIGVIEHMPVRDILMHVPKVLSGKHTRLAEFHSTRAMRATVNVDPGLPLHADGEMVATRARRLDVQLIRSGLSIIVP